jgi:hypothetical protein
VAKLEDLSDPDFNAFAMERLSTGYCPDPYPRIHELMQHGIVVERVYYNEYTDVTDVQPACRPTMMVLGTTQYCIYSPIP